MTYCAQAGEYVLEVTTCSSCVRPFSTAMIDSMQLESSGPFGSQELQADGSYMMHIHGQRNTYRCPCCHRLGIVRDRPWGVIRPRPMHSIRLDLTFGGDVMEKAE
jgi:hypothetical protein